MKQEINAQEELLKEIEEKKIELEDLKTQLENYDDEDIFCEMLDENHKGVFNILPSTILRELDPIAYRCGLADFEDEGRSNLEDEISDLEDEIQDLEDELNKEVV